MSRTVIELQVRDAIKNQAACTRFLLRDLIRSDQRDGGGSTMMLENLQLLDGNEEFELTYSMKPQDGGALPLRKTILVPRENVAGWTFATVADFETGKYLKCDHCGRWTKEKCAEQKCAAKEAAKVPAKAA